MQRGVLQGDGLQGLPYDGFFVISLCQRPQGQLVRVAALRRLRHQQHAQRTDPVFHRPGLAPAPTAVTPRLAAGEPPAAYATRMKAREPKVWTLLRRRWTGQVGDQVMLRTKGLLDASEVGKLRPRCECPFTEAALGCQHVYTDSGAPLQAQSRGHRRPAQTLPLSRGPAQPHKTRAPGPAGSPAGEQLLNRNTYYLVSRLFRV